MALSLRKKRRRKRGRGSSKSHKSKRSFVGKLVRFFVWLFLFFFALGLVLYGLLPVVLSHIFRLEESSNIVFISPPLDQNKGFFILAHFEENSKSTNLINIDSMIPVSVIGGYGEYQLQVVYPLLKLEQKDMQFIRSAFSFILGTTVDEVVIISPEAAKLLLPEENGSLAKYLQQAFRSKEEIAAFKKFMPVYLENDNLVSIHSKEDFSLLSKTATRANTKCQVGVVNTTTTSRLATKVTSVLEGTGFSVLRVTDSGSLKDRTTISLSPSTADCEKLAKRLERLFPVVPVREVNEGLTSQYRVGLVIELGSDFAQAF